jgi:beta-lactamase regulating signal transducer with metallopeptidase domain
MSRIVLTALALSGLLILVALELIILAAGLVGPSALSVRCLVAPASRFDTVVHASAIAIGILTIIPIWRGVRAASRSRMHIGELRAAARSARLATLPRVEAAAATANLTERVDVVNAQRPFAFTYGWLRPRVCVSTGLVALLDDRELEAVLHHERWHADHRDPLRLLLVQSLGTAFAVVPEIQRLVRLYALTVEIAADTHVVAAMGHPRWLAGALVKTVAPPVAAPAFEGYGEGRAAALVGHLPTIPRGRARIAAALLALEVIVLVPLLNNGSLLSLAGFWIHPIC